MQIAVGFSSAHSPHWKVGSNNAVVNLVWEMVYFLGFGTIVFFMFEMYIFYLFYFLFIFYLLFVCNVIYSYLYLICVL
jgi:hypothetical protein